MGLLGFPLLLVILTPIIMIFGFCVGSLFDMFMGTNVTPLFTVGVLVSAAAFIKIEGSLTLLGHILIKFIVAPVVAIFMAFLTAWMAPGLTEQFLSMIEYNGSLVAFAGWGTFAFALVQYLIIGGTVLLAAIVAAVAQR